MTVYVDDMRMKAKVGRMRPARWSHLMADTPEELHDFAVNQLGLKREWAQHEHDKPWMLHYDVTDTKRREAIRLGATETTWRQAGRMALEAAREYRRQHPV